MNIDEAFPSKYISAADLQGREVVVRIARVTVEQLGRNNDPKDNKPVLYFEGKQKGLALNKTNANTVKDVYGKETDNWIGKTIMLVQAWTDYAGKQVECIRVRPTRTNGAAPPQWQAPASQPAAIASGPPPQNPWAQPPAPPTPPAAIPGGAPAQFGGPGGTVANLDDEIPF